MQFKVPQFLDIEDKIFGPFTFRQFVYLTGGAGICFVLFKLLGFVWGAIPIIAIGAFTGALTFYRPNNKPFIFMLEAGTKYLLTSKLYIWEKHKPEPLTKSPIDKEKAGIEAARLAHHLDRGKLRDLAWSLDVLDLSKKQQN